MSKKPDLEEREIFSNAVMPLNMDTNAAEAEKAPPLYGKLIAKAKSVRNIPGALYIASEVMAFDTPSENYKTVYWDNDAKNFMKTFVDPQPIPLLYNHADGLDSGGMFGPGPSDVPPNVAGRVLAYDAAPGMFGTKSAFAGQVVTNKDTIERIYNLMDYTQSISIMPKGYICEVCNDNAMSDDCPHYPGQIIADPNKKGKEKRVTWKLIPKYAVEYSFVLVPGYRNARIVAMEQNGFFGDKAPTTHGRALFSYNKKEGMITVPDNYPAAGDENIDVDKNRGSIVNTRTSLNGGDQEMTSEETKQFLDSFKATTEAVTALATNVAESNKLTTEVLTAVKSSVEAISKSVKKEEVTPPADANANQQAADTKTEAQKAADELTAKFAALETSVNAIVEQNKAILELSLIHI